MNYERKDIQLLSLMWKISAKDKRLHDYQYITYCCKVCIPKCIGDEPSTNDLQRFLRHFERY